jgi:adhesin/invasin
LPTIPSTSSTAAKITYGISIYSGNNQTGFAGTQLAQGLSVHVVNQATGAAVANTKVSWSDLTGGGSLVNPYSGSDPVGNVPTNFKLGSVAGTNTVKASLDSGDSVTFTLTGVVGPASSSTSTITGTGPILNDGVAYSTVTITLKDAYNNAVVGTIPTFHASGSTNTTTSCSSSDSSGVSLCRLSSTTGETKVLILDTPTVVTGGTVVFSPGSVDAAHSSIVATGPVTANGTATSSVTITLKDVNNAAVGGIVPSFSATNTLPGNTYGACSASNATTGISTCTFSSTKAESKIVSLTAPVNKTGNTVVFNAGSASATTSTLTGSGPIEPDGTSTSAITITLQDANHNPISGTVPTFTATNTGSHNTYGVCSSSNSSGISNCTLASTTAETKTLSLTSPVSLTGGTVVFAPGPVVAANSSIVGTGPLVANGVATSTVTITLKDAANVGVSGIIPAFSATDTGSKNTYVTCLSTNASGISTCTFTSTKAETKTLALTSPVSLTGGTVVFTAGPAGNPSTITGTGSVLADGAASSTITITLLDAFNNPISGSTPTFSATDTGNHNTYGNCTSSGATGVSTCSLKSTKAETKTLAIVNPVALTGGTVNFTAGSPSITTSSITGSSPVEPDGTSTSSIIVTLLDQFGNPVAGSTPTFSATNTGSSNVYGPCSSSNSSGISNCTLASTQQEVKTLSLLTPIAMAGGTVTFVAGSASGTYSSITGTANVIANGSATSTITITLKDSANQPIIGVVPTFDATNTGNTNIYGPCSATTSLGVSTCSLTSTKAESKTLQITSPLSKSGSAITFIAGTPSGTTSQITGTGPVLANGVATSTVTIILYDAFNNPISGVVPTLRATNTSNGNVYNSCSSTTSTGVSTCTFSSTGAEIKTLSIATPVSANGGTVVFTSGTASASTSTITGTGPVIADGSASSTITITLLDSNSNPVGGTVPTFSATNTGTTNVYGTCTSANSNGVSTCTLKSSKAETKTLSLLTPVSVIGGTVVFTGSTPVAANSTITGTGPVIADGVASSTVTITLKDVNNNPVQGMVPTFSATDTGSTNAYGVCSSSNRRRRLSVRRAANS